MAQWALDGFGFTGTNPDFWSRIRPNAWLSYRVPTGKAE
eukprot:gene208-285_t